MALVRAHMASHARPVLSGACDINADPVVVDPVIVIIIAVRVVLVSREPEERAPC